MKLIKAINKYKKISIGLASLALVVSSASMSIYYLDHKTNSGGGVLGQTFSRDKKADEHEYIMTQYRGSKSTPIFVYYTPETNGDKLIKLNDIVTKELKKSKKITNKTEEYYIDYFNNKKYIDTYYDTTSRSKMSSIKKISLMSSISAQMIYVKKSNSKSLISLMNGKVLKSY